MIKSSLTGFGNLTTSLLHAMVHVGTHETATLFLGLYNSIKSVTLSYGIRFLTKTSMLLGADELHTLSLSSSCKIFLPNSWSPSPGTDCPSAACNSRRDERWMLFWRLSSIPCGPAQSLSYCRVTGMATKLSAFLYHQGKSIRDPLCVIFQASFCCAVVPPSVSNLCDLVSTPLFACQQIIELVFIDPSNFESIQPLIWLGIGKRISNM